MRYYIADCHFGDDAICALDGRPFASVEEMDAVMSERWNETVRKNDEVVILGDFCRGKGERANALLAQLHGRKYMVTGNHDHVFLRDKAFRQEHFVWIKPYAELHDNRRKLVLCHYPILCYNGQYHGDSTYMLYGHVHATADYDNIRRFQKESTEIQYRPRVQGGELGEPRHLACNLINCFTVFSDYRPLTLDQWIDRQLVGSGLFSQ